jgi:predicted transcriptional regulator of viral defense system
LLRLATGYYVRTPQHRLGDRRWRPELAAAGLAIAQADYGANQVALTHLSAARHHAAIPRALAVATVAIPTQRPRLELLGGTVLFLQRAVDRLDLERCVTELGQGWVTTVEQTLLDLAHRPDLPGADAVAVAEAIRALAARADWNLAGDLAIRQRRRATLHRVRAQVGEWD